jgi:carbonic anhydrase
LQLQLLGYNADLHDNYSIASVHPNGLVSVSILIQLGQLSNAELRKITDLAADVQYGGQHTKLDNFSVAKLLPETHGFMTYEGSQTEPGCSETVTWIIMNRPIYITHKQV